MYKNISEKDFPNAMLKKEPSHILLKKLVNELYELDNRAVRKVISEILNQLETENEIIFDSFTPDLTTNEEEEIQSFRFFSHSFTTEPERNKSNRIQSLFSISLTVPLKT